MTTKSSLQLHKDLRLNILLQGQEIRMRGRNTEDTEYVKAGAYHTLEIEPQRPFEVTKESWDALDLDRLRQACDPAASADLGAVLITVSPAAAAPQSIQSPGSKSCQLQGPGRSLL